MKIGLIAVSGVGAVDQELLRIGLTLPGFVERSKAVASLPSLGLLTLAGMVPAGHECRYHEIEDIHAMRELPDGFDLVAISSFTARIGEAYALADRYRARGIPVVMGGLHVTALPEEAARHADASVVGEGEASWPRVLPDAARGRVAGIYRPQGEVDLTRAPMPAFELLDPARYDRVTVQASRGCPFRCEFCASSVLLTARYKQKPVDRVLEEIDRIREIWRRPFIEFADDNALVDKRYWKRLLSQLRGRKIRWFAETDLSVHEDRELLDLMRESGCTEVLIGFESPNDTGLRGLEMKSDWKHRQWTRYREAIARIQSHGIRVNGCFVLGLDGQGPDIFDQVYRFAEESELFDVQVTLQTPFPGTPLYRRLQAENRLLREDAWEACSLFDVNFLPKAMPPEELTLGFRRLVERLYAEDLTRWRRENFNRKCLKACGALQEETP